MKYTNIEVEKSGYVSSSYDHHVEVTYQIEGKGRYRSTYCITCGAFSGNRGLDYSKPVYMLKEIVRQLAKLILTDAIQWHEYDREGQKRYENLRYYDRNRLLDMVADWQKKGFTEEGITP